MSFQSSHCRLALLLLAVFVACVTVALSHSSPTLVMPVATPALATDGPPLVLAAPHLAFLYNIQGHERKGYSQNNEDGVIEYLFDNLGVTDQYYVEFGTEDGNECNTRHLHHEYGWNGLLMDGGGKIRDEADTRTIFNHFIRSDNIVDLFREHNVPHGTLFDLLSVDIDSNDYYVLKNILEAGYKPRVIVLEANSNFGPEDSYTRQLDETRPWKGNTYMGVSPRAAYFLGLQHGYSLVYYDTNLVNVIFVRNEVLQSYLHSVTGFKFEIADILKLIPPYRYVYRRGPAIHAKDMVEWRKQFSWDPWVHVDADLNETPTTDSDPAASAEFPIA